MDLSENLGILNVDIQFEVIHRVITAGYIRWVYYFGMWTYIYKRSMLYIERIERKSAKVGRMDGTVMRSIILARSYAFLFGDITENFDQ